MRITLAILLTIIIFTTSLGQSQPERVVSLAPSLTRAIYYLEAGSQLAGITTFCHIASDDNKEIVASAVKVNLEKVITLQPDLVVTTAMTDPETLEMLRKAGIRTVVFHTPSNFEETCRQFIELGALMGKESTARRITKEVREEVVAIKSSHNYDTPPAFFFQIGAKPLFTVLENTFMNDYITFSGGRNIAEGFSRGTINREYVLMSNPDVILIVNMGMASEEEKKIRESYTHLNAVKNNRIYLIESDMASTPNPPDFLKTLQVIRGLLEENWWTD